MNMVSQHPFIVQLMAQANSESWRFNSIRTLADVSWQTAEPTSINHLELPHLPENILPIVLGNGFLKHQLFDATHLPVGVAIIHDEAHLHIRIACDTNVTLPLAIIDLCHSTAPSISSPKISVTLASGARLRLLHLMRGVGTYINHTQMRIDLAENAECELIRIADDDQSAFNISQLSVYQASHSILTLTSLQKGGQLTRLDADIHLQGEQAQTHIQGLNQGHAKQMLDHHVTLNHCVAHCQSTQVFRAVLHEQAHSLFDGKIHVFQNAQKTDAQQLSRSLLRSDRARSQTHPRLEIYADDVKCTHGATVGFLDPDQLFYLRTRGLSQQEAEQCLVHAFAMQTLDHLAADEVRVWLSQQLG